jgi:N-acetylglutamate synthase-like GNAT family acetyltransferase
MENVNLQIASLRDNPHLLNECHSLVRDCFNDLDLIHNQLDDTLASNETLPQAYLLIKNGIVAAWVGLCVNDPIQTDVYTPIVGPLMVAESERNFGYGALLLYHARNEAGKLGFDKVYLTSSHIGYYERFGFREIDMTKYFNDNPTKVYVADVPKH